MFPWDKKFGSTISNCKIFTGINHTGFNIFLYDNKFLSNFYWMFMVWKYHVGNTCLNSRSEAHTLKMNFLQQKRFFKCFMLAVSIQNIRDYIYNSEHEVTPNKFYFADKRLVSYVKFLNLTI